MFFIIFQATSFLAESMLSDKTKGDSTSFLVATDISTYSQSIRDNQNLHSASQICLQQTHWSEQVIIEETLDHVLDICHIDVLFDDLPFLHRVSPLHLSRIQLPVPLHSYYVLHYLSINSPPATGSSTVWSLALFNLDSLSINPGLLLHLLPINHSWIAGSWLNLSTAGHGDQLVLYFKIS